MELISRLIRQYGFVLRYGITGLTGAVLQTLILFIWVSLLGLEKYYLWGVTAGFFVALMVTFNLQKYWTFGGKMQAHRTHRQFLLYTLTALIALGLNTLLLYWSKDLLESHGYDFFHGVYLLAQVVIILIVAVVTFVINYFVTFKEIKKDPTFHQEVGS